MIQVIKAWFHRYFSDPQAVLLAILLIASFTILMTMSQILFPVLASVVIAYLLEGLIENLQQWHIPRFLAVSLVYTTFVTLLAFIVIILLPLLAYQLNQLIKELPEMVEKGRNLLTELPKKYPLMISDELIKGVINSIRSWVREVVKTIWNSIPGLIPTVLTLVVYSILVPLLVFFFLKDKKVILNWLVSFLPKDHTVAKKIWLEMDAQIGNYIRGKVYEIFLVATFTYFPFAYWGLNYASLLAVLVGLSVIIPYIGAAVVTFPVVLIAYFQWGLNTEFFWIVGAYAVIQTLDANILVPLLFSEAVNLHPVAIIAAVLIFGGLWGLWGVFFAIPLATLVKVLLTAWPRAPTTEEKVISQLAN